MEHGMVIDEQRVEEPRQSPVEVIKSSVPQMSSKNQQQPPDAAFSMEVVAQLTPVVKSQKSSSTKRISQTSPRRDGSSPKQQPPPESSKLQQADLPLHLVHKPEPQRVALNFLGVENPRLPTPSMGSFGSNPNQSSFISRVLRMTHENTLQSRKQMSLHSQLSLQSQINSIRSVNPFLHKVQNVSNQESKVVDQQSLKQGLQGMLPPMISSQVPQAAATSDRALNQQQLEYGGQLDEITRAELKALLKEIIDDNSKMSDFIWGHNSKPAPKDSNSSKSRYLTRTSTQMVQPSDLQHSDVSISYGEITEESLSRVIAVMISHHFDATSTFADIGSGFGSAVFQIAYETLHYCLGIEIVQTRHEFAREQLCKFQDKYRDKTSHRQYLDLVDFLNQNVAHLHTFTSPRNGIKLTHLYCFDVVMDQQTKAAIVAIINKSPWVKVLACNSSAAVVINQYRLTNFELVESVKVKMRGAENKTFYVYRRTAGTTPPHCKQVELVHQLLPAQHRSILKTPSKHPSRSKQESLHVQIDEESRQPPIQNFSCAEVIPTGNFPKVDFDMHDSQSVLESGVQISSQKQIREFFNFQLSTASHELNVKRQEAAAAIRSFELILSGLVDLSLDYMPLEQYSRGFSDQTFDEWAREYLVRPLSSLPAEQLQELQSNFQSTAIKFCERRYYEDGLRFLLGERTCDKELLSSQSRQLVEDDKFIRSLINKSISSHGFMVTDFIQSGSFGRVYKCVRQEGKSYKSAGSLSYSGSGTQSYALKVPAFTTRVKGAEQTSVREQKNLETLNKDKHSQNNFIVKLESAIPFHSERALLMEYCPYQLDQVIKTSNLSENKIRLLSYCIISGLTHAHAHHIYHLDLKPSNILLTDKWIPRICDWGMVNSNGFSGTLLYTAPERYAEQQGLKIDKKKLDSWALGITLYQLCHQGEYPLESTAMIACIEQGLEIVWGEEIEGAREGIMSVIKQLLLYNQSQRRTPGSLLDDPYFRGLSQLITGSLNIRGIM